MGDDDVSNGENEEQTKRAMSRRSVVVRAAGMLAGAAAINALGGVGDATSGAATVPAETFLTLGQTNTETTTTRLVNTPAISTSPNSSALEVYTELSGYETGAALATTRIGVVGSTAMGAVTSPGYISAAGIAGVGPNVTGGLGVIGLPTAGYVTGSAAGVVGLAGSYGLTTESHQVGVLGMAGIASVTSLGTAPVGVQGVAIDTTAVGVDAVNAGGGLALKVQGETWFSTAGHGTVPKHVTSHTISDHHVTSTSRIFVTFTGNPDGVVISWVACSAGSGFTMHFSKETSASIAFCYFRIS